jgi:hypothetical protein
MNITMTMWMMMMRFIGSLILTFAKTQLTELRYVFHANLCFCNFRLYALLQKIEEVFISFLLVLLLNMLVLFENEVRS